MAQLIDLTGQKFGYLTVLERAENKYGRAQWKCQCECGNIVIIPSGDLRHKNRPRKYCSNQCILRNKPIDLTGQRFGRLITKYIYEDAEHKYKDHGTYWVCECDCGNTTIVQGKDLRNGMVQSCGCLRAELLSKRRSIDLTGQKFGRLTVLKLLSSNSRGNIWQCQCQCGNLTKAHAPDLKNGNKASCGCLKSKGEMTISHYLQLLDIPYEQEYSFPDLKGPVNNLRFDFAIFINNSNDKIRYLIEFDGIQHFFGGQWKNGIPLEEIQHRDALKNNYCALHNVPLIRFNYTELESGILTLEYFQHKIQEALKSEDLNE